MSARRRLPAYCRLLTCARGVGHCAASWKPVGCSTDTRWRKAAEFLPVEPAPPAGCKRSRPQVRVRARAVGKLVVVPAGALPVPA
jgi:hypothetical protein